MAFVTGNFTQNQAIKIVEQVRDIIKLKPVPKD